jgi:hypothetical protein
MKTLRFLGFMSAALIAFPQLCLADCSSPPRGFGSSWARQYKQWCESCGGTYSSRGPSCTPGPNWGSGSSRGSGAPTYSSEPAYDYEAERLRQEEAERQRQREIAEQRKREEEEARRKQAEFERNKQEALNSMKGVGDSELGLKGTDASREFGLKGADGGKQDFGLKGVGEMDPNVVDLRHLDPKKPITVDQGKLKAPAKKETAWAQADCEKAGATRQRIVSGLPVQLDAIRRTEAQINAARKDISSTSEEAKALAMEKTKEAVAEYASEALSTAKALRGQVEALQSVGAGRKTRDAILKSLHTIAFSGEDLLKASGAGYRSGKDLQNKVGTLTDQLVSANKLFVDSGIADKLGETLAEHAGGPLGGFAFKGARLSIDIGVLYAQDKLSRDEYNRAMKNLDIMRTQYRRNEARVTSLDRDLTMHCTGASQAKK